MTRKGLITFRKSLRYFVICYQRIIYELKITTIVLSRLLLKMIAISVKKFFNVWQILHRTYCHSADYAMNTPKTSSLCYSAKRKHN